MHKVRCAECNTPVFEIQNGCMVIISRHRGERHTTVFTRDQLLRLFDDAERGEAADRAARRDDTK